MDANLLTCYGQILARAAERDDIHRLYLITMYICHAPKVLHVRKPVRSHTDREVFNLAGPHRFYPVQCPGKFKPTGTGEE